MLINTYTYVQNGFLAQLMESFQLSILRMRTIWGSLLEEVSHTLLGLLSAWMECSAPCVMSTGTRMIPPYFAMVALDLVKAIVSILLHCPNYIASQQNAYQLQTHACTLNLWYNLSGNQKLLFNLVMCALAWACAHSAFDLPIVHCVIYSCYILTVGTPLFGLNPGPDPIVLESVACTGMESDISSCRTSQLGSVSSMCREPNRAAGVRCSFFVGSCIDGQARLVDGPAFYEGRLEVCLNNQWLSVCDAGFSSETAYDVCNYRLLLTGGGCIIL
jgi:hypothetical protein